MKTKPYMRVVMTDQSEKIVTVVDIVLSYVLGHDDFLWEDFVDCEHQFVCTSKGFEFFTVSRLGCHF